MQALIYAVRPRVVIKYFGQLALLFALLAIVPMAVSLLLGDYAAGWRYAAIVIAVGAPAAGLMRVRTPRQIQTNEAMVVAAMAFVFAPAVMAWPAATYGMTAVDAIFETISAITTTGLTTLSHVANQRPAFLFARSWMQWVGGLGMVVLSLATLIQPGSAAKHLSELEADMNDPIGGSRIHARLVFKIYGILTVIGVLSLGLLDGHWFNALLYSMSAVSTGGFAPHDASLADMVSVTARALVIVLSMAGGVSLILYYRLIQHGWRTLANDMQFKGYMVIGLLTTLVLTVMLRSADGFGWWGALGHGALNGLSAQSTAGFSSLNIARIDPGSKLVLIFAMLIGGGIGSTAGGIKIIRLLILLRLLVLLVQRTAMPRNATAIMRIDGHRLVKNDIQDALSLILLFVILIALSWLPFVMLGFQPLDALFEVVSAVGTVGLSAGITSVSLHPLLKVVLAADMLLGRLEILAWLVLLAPWTWIGKKMED